MVILQGLGRIIYCIPIGIFGVLHFMNAKKMVGLVPDWMPIPLFWVYFTGVILIGTAIFIIAQIKYAELAAFILAILLLMFILLIHLPNVMAGGQRMAMSLPSLLKDAAMMGAALTYAGSSRTVR